VYCTTMGDKLKEIRHTTSDAVEIIRKLGSPEVYGSLEKICQTTQGVKEMMASLREPEMVKNIDNMRLTAEAIENTSKRMETLVVEIKKTGVFEQISETLVAGRNTLTSSDNKKMMNDLTSAIKEMFMAITALIDEMKLAVDESKKSGLLYNVDEVGKEASNFYHALRE
jgi:hypothetical protein